MKESYGKGITSRADPESCAGVRKGASEALTGAHAGRVLSRESLLPGADAVELSGRRNPARRHREARRGPCAVVDPVHAWKHLVREPGGPASARSRMPGRKGKSKDLRPR